MMIMMKSTILVFAARNLNITLLTWELCQHPFSEWGNF